MSRRRASLLDVNVLVALFDADHVHHDLAHDWFADARSKGWATCPITENGAIRVLANPKYGSSLSDVPALLDLLNRFRASGHHEFWDDSVSLADETLFAQSFIQGHRQLTDVYLLGLATRKQGQLVTFDRSISPRAVLDATAESLVVIGSPDSD